MRGQRTFDGFWFDCLDFIEAHLEHVLSLGFTFARVSVIFERRDVRQRSVWFGAAGPEGRI
jgi:hypothetical protein